MKTCLLFLVALCGFSSLFAQASTIQVSVSDTIEVFANHLSVIISFKDTSYAREQPVDLTASREEVIRLLDGQKVSWKKASEKMGFMGTLSRLGGDNGQVDNDLSADFHSPAQLADLLPKIKAIAYTSVLETGSSVDKGSVDMNPLYAKLLKKAQAKADMLARLAGKKVGPVYQIGSAFDAFNPSNAMESMMGGGSAYGEMMKSLLGNMFGEKREDHKVTITENLTVTYLLQ